MNEKINTDSIEQYDPEKAYISEDWLRFCRYSSARAWLSEKFPHGADLDLHAIVLYIQSLEEAIDTTTNYISHENVWTNCGCKSTDLCTSEVKRLRLEMNDKVRKLNFVYIENKER